jgi:hypothetical protein
MPPYVANVNEDPNASRVILQPQYANTPPPTYTTLNIENYYPPPTSELKASNCKRWRERWVTNAKTNFCCVYEAFGECEPLMGKHFQFLIASSYQLIWSIGFGIILLAGYLVIAIYGCLEWCWEMWNKWWKSLKIYWKEREERRLPTRDLPPPYQLDLEGQALPTFLPPAHLLSNRSYTPTTFSTADPTQINSMTWSYALAVLVAA